MEFEWSSYNTYFLPMYDVPGTQNTHKIGTYYTKQMVMTMMMQAFLSCRVNVAIELRCLYVFRLNYVKGKCCTCTHTLHTGLCDGVRTSSGWKFVSLFCFNFCWFFSVCIFCVFYLLFFVISLTFFSVFHIFLYPTLQSHTKSLLHFYYSHHHTLFYFIHIMCIFTKLT